MSKNIKMISEDGISLICSLIRESHSVSDGINDVIVSDTTTFSSHRIQTLMDALSEEDRKYTENLIGNLKRLVTEVVDTIPTVDTAQTNTLYLYKASGDTSNTYAQYMFINDSIVSLGTTEVNLDGYYTSEEVDNKFAKLVDLGTVEDNINNIMDGTTVVGDSDTVDGKHADAFLLRDGNVPMTGNLTMKQSAFYDDGTKLTVRKYTDDTFTTCADMYINPSNDWGEVFKVGTNKSGSWKYETVFHTGNISTSIDSTSADNQIPSAKAVYNQLNEHQIKSFTSLEAIGLTDGDMNATDFATNFIKIKNAMPNSSELMTLITNHPNLSASIIEKLNIDRGSGYATTSHIILHYRKFYNTNAPTMLGITIDSASGVKYFYECIIDTTSAGEIRVGKFRAIYNSNANTCTTTVDDIAKTTFEFTNTTNWSIPNTNLETFYLVKNGWCFLHVVAHCNKVASDDNSTVFTGLPIPPFQVYGNFVGNDNTYEPCQLTVGTGGQMILRGGTVGKDYSFTYTYPVTE